MFKSLFCKHNYQEIKRYYKIEFWAWYTIKVYKVFKCQKCSIVHKKLVEAKEYNWIENAEGYLTLLDKLKYENHTLQHLV